MQQQTSRNRQEQQQNLLRAMNPNGMNPNGMNPQQFMMMQQQNRNNNLMAQNDIARKAMQNNGQRQV
jgi:hypothetical protein